MKNKKKNQRIYALCLAFTLTAGSIIPGCPGTITTLKAESETENPKPTIYEQKAENSAGNDREAKNYLVVMKDEAAYEKMETIMEAEQEALEDVQKKILPNLPLSELVEQQTEEENSCREELLEETNTMVRTMTDTQAEKLEQNKNIEYIEEDIKCTGSDDSENTDTENTDIESLSQEEAEAICQIIKDGWNKKAVNIPEAKNTEDKEKTKKKIAILDSGTAITADIDIQERIHLVGEEVSYLCEDLTGHGTAVASIIGAKDNEEGTSGIDENLEIYSVTVLDENNTAPVSRIIAGLQWCIENDIDIINMSFGTTRNSRALEEKIQEAADKGILLIAAAGNNGTEKDSVEYPAAYDEVIAVGSTTATMERAEHSAQGEEIELMAPGENVPIESLLGATTVGSGTSYAAPHVTAVAALLWQEEPGWEAGKIRALLQAGARKFTEENSGYGIVDYQYTKDIQSDFDTTYERKDKETAIETYKNEEELTEYEMPKVVANWKSTEHETLINSSLGKKTEAWQKAYGNAKIKALQQVSKVQDGDSTLHEIDELHANGYTNYVAVTCYLYRYASLQHVNSAKSLEDINKEIKSYGEDDLKLTETQIKKLNRAILRICNKKTEKKNAADEDYIPNAGYGESKSGKGKERALRILGMALHVAGDAYAHKAVVPSGKELDTKIAELKEEGKLTKSEAKKVRDKQKNDWLTTAGIAGQIDTSDKVKQTLNPKEYGKKVARKKDCHGATADTPKFLPGRYQYGAQHAVTALLRGYYNKTVKCSSSVFYGGGNNKIAQYRLWNYIHEVYPGENEAKWRKISGGDTAKLQPAD